MKNDLTQFEKKLLRAINTLTGEKYTHENFMEWATSETIVKNNLQDGEKMFNVLGVYVAIKL